ncbi:MAG: hypothetical protein EZS28_014979 [Streblomastix strix]|uniref:Uncharacterized protein n=1 Tax=Streblomastix strix TaxID=222440 RepID=A0A5J4W3Y9_9EUKA|nr:MAG: hypothetical protein EZS28_014979 [Streblomastix strix]
MGQHLGPGLSIISYMFDLIFLNINVVADFKQSNPMIVTSYRYGTSSKNLLSLRICNASLNTWSGHFSTKLSQELSQAIVLIQFLALIVDAIADGIRIGY